jgi:hypothetical protein
MDIKTETYANCEKGKTEPLAAHFQPVIQFLGYDSKPPPRTPADRMEAKRKALGVTLVQVAQYLGSVWIQRDAITAAAIWIMAAKL